MGVLDGEEVSRCGLTGPALAVVEALISAPIAWRSPAHLAAGSGLSLAAVFCGLSDLEAGEWICHWETDHELTVTLTPIGAARLGVRLAEFGPDELPRWITPETPEPSPPKAKGIFRDYEALTLVPGPTIDPVEMVEELPGLPGNAADQSRGYAHLPGIFLSASAQWWGPYQGGICPYCRSVSHAGAYCLYCDGVDADARRKPNRRRVAKRLDDARQQRRDRRKARFS